jgi:hypothetical protein
LFDRRHKRDACAREGIEKNTLKRVGDDTDNNFNWMSELPIGAYPVTSEILIKLESNRKGVNDRTNKEIYGGNSLKPDEKNRGYFYSGDDSDIYPEFTGTEFEKKVKKLILDELAKEGSYGSINTYDGEIFTWGKGFAVKGNIAFEKVLSNVGIRIVEGAFWVLSTDGTWLKDIPGRDKNLYMASKYIASNTQLLSFFIELAEKKDYQKSIANAQYKVFEQGAGKFPSYVLNQDKSGYSSNWDDESVTVLSHLSHWCGYSWSTGERYKETNGQLSKILYIYIYNTVLGYPDTRSGEVIETNIYRWNNLFPLIDNLDKFGKTKGIGLTEIEQTWSSNIVEFEFKKDKEKKLRVIEKDTKNQLAETNCVLITKDSKYILLNKDATTIKYENFKD